MTQPTNPQQKDAARTNDVWQGILERRGATFENGRAAQFSSLGREAQALGKAGLVPLLGTSPLRLTGADRLEFLHGQVSHEVKRLRPGESRPALMLNVRGHALALMRVYRRADDLFVAVEGGAGERVQAQLKAHIIFDQVAIDDLTGTLQTLTLQGSAAGETIRRALQADLDQAALPEESAFVEVPFESAKVLVSATPRSRAGGYDLHVLTEDAPALVAALEGAGAQLAGEAALRAVRVAAGIAEAEFDGGEGVLPQEAGLGYALSYRKGCYLGQEIMARIEARGTLRRRLVGLRLSARPEAETQDVLLAGKKVGRLGSVAEHPGLGYVALGSVRTEVAAGTELEVGSAIATVAELPFETG